MPDIACGAMQRRLDNAEQAEAEWKAAAERATALADRLADAIEQISAALDGPAPVNRARIVIAGLDHAR
jgi:hypothetical protein